MALGWVRYYAKFDRQETTFPWEVIENKISNKYLRGLVNLKADSLRRILQLKNEKIEDEMALTEQGMDGSIDPKAASVVLYKQLNDIPTKFAAESPEEPSRWPYLIKGTEEDMISLIRLLSTVIRRLTRGNPNNNNNISSFTSNQQGNENEMDVDEDDSGEVDDELLVTPETPLTDFLRHTLIQVHPNNARVLQSLKLLLKYLKQLSIFVHTLYYDKGYLFADLGDSLNVEKLHESIQQNFDKLTLSTADQATHIRNLRSLQQIGDCLLEEKNRHIMGLYTSQPIRLVLAEPLASVDMRDDELDQLLPKSIRCRQAGSFLRQVFLTCAKIQNLLIRFQPNHVYKELIPDDLQHLQPTVIIEADEDQMDIDQEKDAGYETTEDGEDLDDDDGNGFTTTTSMAANRRTASMFDDGLNQLSEGLWQTSARDQMWTQKCEEKLKVLFEDQKLQEKQYQQLVELVRQEDERIRLNFESYGFDNDSFLKECTALLI